MNSSSTYSIEEFPSTIESTRIDTGYRIMDNIGQRVSHFIKSVITDTICISELEIPIIESVSKQNIQLTEAALYTALKKLLKEGKIASYTGQNKKGMNRRYYQITPLGKKELKSFRKDWVMIENTLSQLVDGSFKYFREN